MTKRDLEEDDYWSWLELQIETLGSALDQLTEVFTPERLGDLELPLVSIQTSYTLAQGVTPPSPFRHIHNAHMAALSKFNDATYLILEGFDSNDRNKIEAAIVLIAEANEDQDRRTELLKIFNATRVLMDKIERDGRVRQDGPGMSRTNLAPRKVWTGFMVPGKKMAKIVGSEKGMRRGQELIDLYEGEPAQALFAAACALDAFPEGAKHGPALRDIGSELQPGKMYGAILTDIRDFLKLRFRADYLDPSEVGTAKEFVRELADGHLPAAKDAEMYILRAISGLDALSREATFQQLENATRTLRDLLITATIALAPERSKSTYQEIADGLQSERPRSVEGRDQ